MSNIDIFKAIRSNDIKAIKRYIKQGGNLNIRNGEKDFIYSEISFSDNINVHIAIEIGKLLR